MNHTDRAPPIIIDDWVRLILDSLYDGILIIDAEGIVVYVNPAYTRITSVPYDGIVGRRLSEVRPGSLLTEIMTSGKQRLGVRRSQGASEYIVNMVPIRRGGIIVGAVSLLNEVNDIYRLAKELDRSNRLIRRLKDRVAGLHAARYTFDDIISADPSSRVVKDLARRLAEKDLTTLVLGESGTGKELYAQSMHNASQRSREPFLAVNCASLEGQLLESELFGYEDGAFTGAAKGGKVGIFEAANGGTVFLDEIAELDYRLQAKLLRVLQEQRIRPVGGSTELSIDVRVIAATNKDLERLASDGRFRGDLYYRLSVFTLQLNPLRERPGDIPPLIERFLDDVARRHRKNATMHDEAYAALSSYEWPGNVRELKNTIEYAALMADGDVIGLADLPSRMRHASAISRTNRVTSLAEACKRAERQAIRDAFDLYGDSVEGKRLAAQALGVSLSTLYGKLKALY